MSTTFKYSLTCFLTFCCFFLWAQGDFYLPKDRSNKIRFKLINNIIILPVQLNGVELSFVLDTGVSKPILFNLVNSDSLQIKNVETIFLRGLGGDGAIEALKSKRNTLKIGDAINVNQDVFVVYDSSINFTPRLGVSIHGIIGYDIFKEFVVEINYSSKYIRLYKPDTFKYKTASKWETLPINLYKNKPYLNAEVNINSKFIPIKLLIDSGGSDALWLFEDKELALFPSNDLYFDDFLGIGLSGSIYGKRSRVKAFKIGPFIINNVNVAFPDSLSLSTARNYRSRNGSISGNLLKRFNIFFDYENKKIQIKKNSNFKSPFYYNNSGITLEQRGVRVVRELLERDMFNTRGNQNDNSKTIDLRKMYKITLKPSFQIIELREGSNAKAAGLLLGDVIVSVNGKKTSIMSLQEVNKYFFNKENKLIRLIISRKEQLMNFQFKLDDVFKKRRVLKK